MFFKYTPQASQWEFYTQVLDNVLSVCFYRITEAMFYFFFFGYSSSFIQKFARCLLGFFLSLGRRAKELVESDGIYRYRGLIEGIFGEIKNDVGSYERTKSFHIAQLFVLAKFCLFNLWVLFLILWIFQMALSFGF